MGRKKNYNEVLVSPLHSTIKGFNSIVEYYIYYAPGMDTAYKTPELADPNDDIFNRLIREANLEQSHKVVARRTAGTWNSFNLNEDVLDFEYSRLIITKMKNETNIRALLRHIRNSFAHGYVYVWKKKTGNFIYLVDYDAGGNKISAKLMLSAELLKKWQNILEEYCK